MGNVNGAETYTTISTRRCAAIAGRGVERERYGPGDHVQYVHPGRPGKVTLDMGVREVPTGTLRSIYRQAGWDW
ncbi:type II toxin-antitoxin system HicA family toxin [Rhizobium sp. 0TCS1.26]|uniref:type II toxin-antitoxin system HicA family toxin n=1 Tax=Rhizobium sp. 0TCS1.26 TaxID=3142623 RepID=UPI003D28F031